MPNKGIKCWTLFQHLQELNETSFTFYPKLHSLLSPGLQLPVTFNFSLANPPWTLLLFTPIFWSASLIFTSYSSLASWSTLLLINLLTGNLMIIQRSSLRNGSIGLLVWYFARNGCSWFAMHLKKCNLATKHGSLGHSLTTSYDLLLGLFTLPSSVALT